MIDYVFGWGLAYLAVGFKLLVIHVLTLETLVGVMMTGFFLELAQGLRNR